MRNMARLGLALVVVAAGLMVAAPSAQAISFNFTSDHCTGGCGTPPFGTVTLTTNGTGVDFVVHLNSPNFFVKAGSSDFQAFKFNATGVTVADISIVQNAPKPLQANDASPGSFNGDGTGLFQFGISCPLCANGAGGRFNSDIDFTVANAVIGDFLTANNLGILFVADIISCSTAACGSGNGTGNTGPVDVTASVAEPSSLFFFGSAMVLAGMLGRRWKRR